MRALLWPSIILNVFRCSIVCSRRYVVDAVTGEFSFRFIWLSHTGWRRQKENSFIDANNSSNHSLTKRESQITTATYNREKVFSDFSRSDFIVSFCCLCARASKRMFVYFVVANFHLARATICGLSVWSRALKPNSVLCNFRIEFNSHQLFRVSRSRFIPMFMIFFSSFGPICWTAGAAASRYRVCVCASAFGRCDWTFGIRGGHFCVCVSHRFAFKFTR